MVTHKATKPQVSAVDDSGVKYVGKELADHLIGVLEEFYEVQKDWEGNKYCGKTLDWDYNW